MCKHNFGYQITTNKPGPHNPFSYRQYTSTPMWHTETYLSLLCLWAPRRHRSLLWEPGVREGAWAWGAPGRSAFSSAGTRRLLCSCVAGSVSGTDGWPPVHGTVQTKDICSNVLSNHVYVWNCANGCYKKLNSLLPTQLGNYKNMQNGYDVQRQWRSL